MTPTLWFIAGALAVALFVALTVILATKTGSVRNLGLAVGLAAPESLRAKLASRIRGSRLAFTIGSLIGLTLTTSALVLSGAPSDDENPALIWLLAGGVVAGGSLASAIYALTARPVLPEGERIARSGAVSLDDYLDPVDLLGARLAVGAGILSLGITLWFAPETVSAAAALIVVLAVVSLVFFEVAIRRILNRPQPAGSTAELAWDDALRGLSMRNIASAPMSFGVWGGLAVLLNVWLNGTSPIASAVAGGAALALFLATFAAAAWSIASKPPQRYLRRLWPDVAAAAVTKAN
jgi:hypothetical protein